MWSPQSLSDYLTSKGLKPFHLVKTPFEGSLGDIVPIYTIIDGICKKDSKNVVFVFDVNYVNKFLEFDALCSEIEDANVKRVYKKLQTAIIIHYQGNYIYFTPSRAESEKAINVFLSKQDSLNNCGICFEPITTEDKVGVTCELCSFTICDKCMGLIRSQRCPQCRNWFVML